MSLTLGEKLRRAREERGISISEVAEQTRISPHYLNSIENDDYRTLPGGIFNKGFVKSYARFVGIDEQEALQDYATLMASQEWQQEDEPKTYRPEVLTDDRASSSILPTIIFAVVILGLMTWGLLSLVRYIQSGQEEPATNVNTAEQTNQPNTSLTNTNIVPPPATDRISIELRAVGGDVWMSYLSDGDRKTLTLKPDAPVKEEPKESFRVTYHKDKAPNVQLQLNGRDIKLPTGPTNAKRNTIEFEITKENLVEIVQSGQITPEATATPATTR